MDKQLEGVVEWILFSTPDKSYGVFKLRDDNDELHIVVTKIGIPNIGDDLTIIGYEVMHKKFGLQLMVRSYYKRMPSSLSGALRYLERLSIRGLGKKSIEKIGNFFEDRLVEVLRDSPEELLQVPDVKESVKIDLANYLQGSGILTDITLFLEEHGISSRWAGELYDRYGSKAISVIQKNPYLLMNLEDGASFAIADAFASRLHFEGNASIRIFAGVQEVFAHMEDSGHTCIPVDELIDKASTLLKGYVDEVVEVIEHLMEAQELIYCELEGLQYLYLPELFQIERESAALTLERMEAPSKSSLDVVHFLSSYEKVYEVQLGKAQKEAIHLALDNPLTVITGGPGTGKTTTIKVLVQAFQKAGYTNVFLCAPTGRAAKRLSETTGFEASTIHRLLIPIMAEGEYAFERNEDNPLEAEVVIIDEASMLNIRLYKALIEAIPQGAHIVLVGDVNQLPPIGAGFVLRDLLKAELIPYCELNEIYRQQEGNDIVKNAHLINQGIMPQLSTEGEFTFIPTATNKELKETLCEVFAKELAEGTPLLDIQVISPMRRGEVGSISLSEALQKAINPKVKDQREVKVGTTIFRLGDKVIQAENNYDKEVFNGEVGIVYGITDKSLLVRFSDKEKDFLIEDLKEEVSLLSAYAITVHKSQGSEYHTVIIPFNSSYTTMLQRNLLYTAVTRAREKVILVGSENAIQKALLNEEGDFRYTLFKERLQGLL